MLDALEGELEKNEEQLLELNNYSKELTSQVGVQSAVSIENSTLCL